MNINNIEDPEKCKGDMLDEIFKRQTEMVFKYHPIEKKNGILLDENIPINFDSSKGQYRLKDAMWRVTEELGEYYSANLIEHKQEEIADVMHFFIELIILSGIPSYRLCYQGPDIIQAKLEFIFNGLLNSEHYIKQLKFFDEEHLLWFIIHDLTLAGGCLKNKPWKQTHVRTDKLKYDIYIIEAFKGFIALCIKNNLTAEKLYNLYFRKNEVNKFRIKSNY